MSRDGSAAAERLAGYIGKLIEAATPGPWRAYKPDDGHKPAVFIARRVGQPREDTEAQFYVAAVYAGAEREGNARLMAATGPQFLEDIKALIKTAGDVVSGEGEERAVERLHLVLEATARRLEENLAAELHEQITGVLAGEDLIGAESSDRW